MISPAIRTTVRVCFEALHRASPKLATELAEMLFLRPWKSKAPAGAEARFLAEGERSSIPFKGATLACWAWGKGPTVLLVHGWSERSGMWNELGRALVRSGYRVVAFDGPAHGESTRMAEGKRPMLTENADAVRAVLAHVGEVDTVVAHSFGGPSAVLALSLGSAAKNLVLFAPLCDILLANQQFGQVVGIPEAVMQNVRENMRRRYHDSAAKYGPDWPSWSVRVVGPRLSQRVLVLHDEKDRMMPIAQGELIARSCPRAEMHRTTGLGHTRICSDAPTIERVIGFMKSSGAREKLTTHRIAVA